MRHNDPHLLICDALAGMQPATVDEVSRITALDPVTTASCLETLRARHQVMFNPLTKRFSLPKPRLLAGIAA